MKKNLEIQEFEEKKTQAGKEYTRFKTSEGWMSCFDSKSSKALKELKGKVAAVEVIQSGEFQNIKKFYSEGDSASEDSKEVEVVKVSSNGKKEMYVSYAKDIFCAAFKGHEEEDPKQIMEHSINLVKQAKKAFE